MCICFAWAQTCQIASFLHFLLSMGFAEDLFPKHSFYLVSQWWQYYSPDPHRLSLMAYLTNYCASSSFSQEHSGNDLLVPFVEPPNEQHLHLQSKGN